jgi:hypothetical protein
VTCDLVTGELLQTYLINNSDKQRQELRGKSDKAHMLGQCSSHCLARFVNLSSIWLMIIITEIVCCTAQGMQLALLLHADNVDVCCRNHQVLLGGLEAA